LISTSAHGTARNPPQNLFEESQFEQKVRYGRALPAVNNSEHPTIGKTWTEDQKWQLSSFTKDTSPDKIRHLEVLSSAHNHLVQRPSTQGHPQHNQYANPLNNTSMLENLLPQSLEGSNSKTQAPSMQRLNNLPYPLFRGGATENRTTKHLNIVLKNNEVPAFSIVGTQAGYYGER
jgi:hypothetical protein